MKLSGLRTKANKSQVPADLSKYKKQCNLVVKLSKTHKKEYFENLNVATNSKPFWDKCKSHFSNKHAQGDFNIVLIEKDEILLKKKKIAGVLNSYFDSVPDSLDLFSWSTQTDNKTTDAIQNILKSFHNHPRLIKSRQLTNNQAKFPFQRVSVHTVKNVIEGLSSNKATAGEIPIKNLKESGFTFEYWTSCVDEAISSCKFLDSLKLSNIVTVHEKKDPADKCNYSPVSILPLLSKVFEKIMYDQLYIYIINFLNELICGFRKALSTQHAIFKLLQARQKELENSGFIGTIPMDLSKAYDCLPLDLLIAKFGAYGLQKSSLRLIMDYLNSRNQRAKVGSSYRKWSEIKHGIPQGSILEPLLFNKFINDLFFVLEKSDICNFADGNTLNSCGENLKTVLENLKHYARKRSYWFKTNSMKANPEKRQFMILSKKILSTSKTFCKYLYN